MTKTIVLIICLTLSAPASAESMFRCTDSDFAHRGDSSAKVRLKCGSPDSVYDLRGAGSRNRVETWAYRHPNNDSWATALTFKNGTLVRIEGLGRID